jgi:magnesium transporter
LAQNLRKEESAMEHNKLEILREFRNLINAKQFDLLKQKANALEPFFLADIIEVLEPGKQSVVFRLLNKEHALEVFEYIETDVQQELIQNFTDAEALTYFDNLEPDDRAALMDELPAKVAKYLLQSLSKKEKDLTALVMGYPSGSAGNIMTPKYISFKKGITCADALDRIRQVGDDVETIYHLYVTNATRQLVGMIELRDLITADPKVLIDTIMIESPVKAYVNQEDGDVAKLLQDSDLLAVPVVDKDDRLVGVVTVDDAIDVLEEDAIDRELTSSGFLEFNNRETDRSRILVSGSLWEIWKVRVPFLLITLAGGMIAGSVIEQFEETLMAITALAFFIPVVMDMGGNVGTQSSTIFTRALALGQIDFPRFIRQWAKEVLVGFTMGIMLGIGAGLIVYLWQGDLNLTFVIGFALLFTVTIATALGFMVPFLLLKTGADQAAAAAPFITTIKDITGLLIYFLLANIFLTI